MILWILTCVLMRSSFTINLRPRKLTYSMWLNPRSVAYISVMTVSSVWNLIKDSSYLYWHSLSASDWSSLSQLASHWLPGDICVPIVWLRVAQSWIKLWLAWTGHRRHSIYNFILLIVSMPGARRTSGDISVIETEFRENFWWCLVLCWCVPCLLTAHLSVSFLVTFSSHKSQMSHVPLTPRFRRKVQC